MLHLLSITRTFSHKVLSEIAPSISEMIFMTAKQVVINGIECLITRSGYTGEDGFEISLAAKDSEELAKLLLSQHRS